MKCEGFSFSLKNNDKKSRMSSTAMLLDALRVKLRNRPRIFLYQITICKPKVKELYSIYC